MGFLDSIMGADSGQPTTAVPSSLAQSIMEASGRLGIDPVHLATAISYETGGKFDPNLWGGAGGNYLGLIQFGPEERAKYGVKEGQTANEQMGAVENFLRDRGVKPGMGLPDIYSTINAGSPGRYNASDANNGGAPGTVMDKVRFQMAGHEAKARAMLGGQPLPANMPRPANSMAARVASAIMGTPQEAAPLPQNAGDVANQLMGTPQAPAFDIPPMESAPIQYAKRRAPDLARLKAALNNQLFARG